MSGALPNDRQQANQDNVDAQKARPWDRPTNPHDPRTTDAGDWNKRAKDSGLI